jgi:hypothetical protein
MVSGELNIRLSRVRKQAGALSVVAIKLTFGKSYRQNYDAFTGKIDELFS